MENFKESHEAQIPESKILSGQELIDRIYRGERYPQDKRFLHIEQGGSFKYFNLSDITGFSAHHRKNKFYPLVEITDRIVALSELEQDPNNSENFWIKFVSVDKEEQGNGYARLLLNKMFDFAKENNYTLEPSRYSLEGEQKVKKIIEQLAEEKGVTLTGRYI